jgi:hypothetical protein
VLVAKLMKNGRSGVVAAVLMFDWGGEKACNETCKIVFGFRGANVS